MNTEREILRAITFLPHVISDSSVTIYPDKDKEGNALKQLVDILQKALANKPEAKPVAWHYRFKNAKGWGNWFTTPVGAEKPENVAFEDIEVRPLIFGDTSPSTAALQKRIEELEAVISKKDEALIALEPLTRYGVVGSRDVDQAKMQKALQEALSLKAGDVQAPLANGFVPNAFFNWLDAYCLGATITQQFLHDEYANMLSSDAPSDVQAPKEGWISVEDRLPEPYIPNDATEYKGVLAYVVSEHSGWGGYPMLLWYGEFPKYDENGYEIEGETQFGWHYERDSEGEFDTLTFNMNGKVSHWMPVAAAPTDKEGK